MAKLPEFIPILTSFTERVSGRGMTELLASPAKLTRALLETQKLIGHDGVLCLFDPTLLASACLGRSGSGPRVLEPQDVPRKGSFATLLEASRALQQQLPKDVQAFTTVSGPALLSTQLRQAGVTLGEQEESYVEDVVTACTRAALETGCGGLAVLERQPKDIPTDFRLTYRTCRRLADFYEVAFIVFQLASSQCLVDTSARCVFRLSPPVNGLALLEGESEEDGSGDTRSWTTNGDVSINCTVEEVRTLFQRAREPQTTRRAGR